MQSLIALKLENSRGFTLVETIIGLLITGVVIMMCTIPLLKFLDYMAFSQTLATFRNDVNLVRQHNMMPGNSLLQLKIYPDSQKIELQYSSSLKVYLKREIPKNHSFGCSGADCIITFNSKGNITKAGTISVSSKYFKKQLVFAIGAGGLDIRDP